MDGAQHRARRRLQYDRHRDHNRSERRFAKVNPMGEEDGYAAAPQHRLAIRA
jgi:hypothetical protein